MFVCLFSDALVKSSEIWLALALLHRIRGLKKIFTGRKTEMEEDDLGAVLPGTEVTGKPKRILKLQVWRKANKAMSKE